MRASYGASADDVEKVRAFAAEYGLKVASENRAQRTVKLSGTVQQFSRAFGAKLRRCEHDSRTYYGRTGELTIPAELESVVEGVFGLDNRPQAKTHFRILTKKPGIKAQAAAVSYSPVQVAKAYGFPSGATGAGQCIAIIELGGGYNTSDLNSFFGNLGIATPSVTTVSVDGATNSPTGDANGPDGEVELDIEVAGSIAPGCEDRRVLCAEHGPGIHRRHHHRGPRCDIEAIDYFDQLGWTREFMDGAGA